MNYYGIRNILPWIKDFLTSRKQSVVIDGVKSRLVTVLSGIPQGMVLAGLLFLIFINDLPNSVTESFTGVFCDDTLLAKEIKNQSDALDLQNDLNNELLTYKFCMLYKSRLNNNNTEYWALYVFIVKDNVRPILYRR